MRSRQSGAAGGSNAAQNGARPAPHGGGTGRRESSALRAGDTRSIRDTTDTDNGESKGSPAEYVAPRRAAGELLPVSDCLALSAMLAPDEAACLEAKHPNGLDEADEAEALGEALPRWRDECDRLRVLWTAHGNAATKTYRLDDDGTIRRTDFDAGYRFKTQPTRTIATVEDATGLLRDLAADPRAFLIRGTLRPGADSRKRHRRKMKGDDAAFMPAPSGRTWLTLDVDGLPIPDDIDPIRDPRGAAEYACAQLPEPFRSAACCYQLSSSTGFAKVDGTPKGTYRLGRSGTVSLHLLFRAARPVMDKAAEEWAKSINVEAGRALLDVATLRSVQPYYCAAPIFDGLDDPLPLAERIGTLDGTPTVAVPDDVPTPGEWWAEQTLAQHRREVREAEQAAAREAAKARAAQWRAEAEACGEAVDDHVSEGLPDWRQPDLARFFVARGDLGDPLHGADGYAVRCPWHELHSDGRDGLDGDTAIIRNDDGPGWHIVCMHGSHGGRGSITNRDLREMEPTEYDAVCPRTYYPRRADAEAEAVAAAQPVRPFVLPPLPPGAVAVPFDSPAPPRDELPDAPDWLNSSAGAGGILDRLRAEKQTAPHLRSTARALAANSQRGKSTGIMSRCASSKRWGELAWNADCDGGAGRTEKVDNDQCREPRWHPLDARNKGRDTHRALLATLGLIRPTTRDDDPDAPPPLVEHRLAARAFVVEDSDFGEAKAVAAEALKWLTPKARLPAGAGCLLLLDRGHSTWAPDSVTLPVLLIYSAPDGDTLDKVGEALDAAPLPPGASWIEPGLVPLRPLDAARLVARVVEAVPRWAGTAAAVAADLAHFKGVQLIRRTGALRDAWREPKPSKARMPDDARDVLDLDACEAEADDDAVGVYAAVISWENNARLHLSGASLRRPVVRVLDDDGRHVYRDDPAIRWRVTQLAVRLEPAWRRWCGGARPPDGRDPPHALDRREAGRAGGAPP